MIAIQQKARCIVGRKGKTDKYDVCICDLYFKSDLTSSAYKGNNDVVMDSHTINEEDSCDLQVT